MRTSEVLIAHTGFTCEKPWEQAFISKDLEFMAWAKLVHDDESETGYAWDVKGMRYTYRQDGVDEDFQEGGVFSGYRTAKECMDDVLGIKTDEMVQTSYDSAVKRYESWQARRMEEKMRERRATKAPIAPDWIKAGKVRTDQRKKPEKTIMGELWILLAMMVSIELTMVLCTAIVSCTPKAYAEELQAVNIPQVEAVQLDYGPDLTKVSKKAKAATSAAKKSASYSKKGKLKAAKKKLAKVKAQLKALKKAVRAIPSGTAYRAKADVKLEKAKKAYSKAKKAYSKAKKRAKARGSSSSLSRLRSAGVVYFGGWRYTWYSQRVLPGGGLGIPGRHVGAGGGIYDGSGRLCVASSSHSKGAVISTPFGIAKVYDTGCPGGTIDVYVNW